MDKTYIDDVVLEIDKRIRDVSSKMNAYTDSGENEMALMWCKAMYELNLLKYDILKMKKENEV